MKPQLSVKHVVERFFGEQAVVAIPRVLLLFCEGDLPAALVLSQLGYWCTTRAGKDGFAPVPYSDWASFGLSEKVVRSAVRRLNKRNILIETILRKVNGAPTIHFRIDLEALGEELEKWMDGHPILPSGQNGNRPQGRMETAQKAESMETAPRAETSTIDIQSFKDKNLAAGAAGVDEPDSLNEQDGDEALPGDETASRPPARKKRPRDLAFEALAEVAFGLAPGAPIGKDTRGRLNRILKELRTEWQPLEPTLIRHAFAWGAARYPDRALPKAPATIADLLREYQAAKRHRPGPSVGQVFDLEAMERAHEAEVPEIMKYTITRDHRGYEIKPGEAY